MDYSSLYTKILGDSTRGLNARDTRAFSDGRFRYQLMKTISALCLLLVGIYCNETTTLPVAVDSVIYGNIVDVKTVDSTSSTTTTTPPTTTTTTNMDITDTPETVDGSGTAQEAPDNTENNSDNTQSTPAETNLPEDSFLLAHVYPASNDIDVYDPSNDTTF